MRPDGRMSTSYAEYKLFSLELTGCEIKQIQENPCWWGVSEGGQPMCLQQREKGCVLRTPGKKNKNWLHSANIPKNEKREAEVSNVSALNTDLRMRAWPAECWVKGGDPRSHRSPAGSESQPEHESTEPACCENVRCQHKSVYTEL